MRFIRPCIPEHKLSLSLLGALQLVSLMKRERAPKCGLCKGTFE